jgi:hypothetical protein
MTYHVKEQLKTGSFFFRFLSLLEKELLSDETQNFTKAFTKKVGQVKALPSLKAIMGMESNQEWNTREKRRWGGRIQSIMKEQAC